MVPKLAVVLSPLQDTSNVAKKATISEIARFHFDGSDAAS
jgi:hypothetical protein